MLKFIGVWMIEWLWCLSDLILKPRKLPYHKGYQREMDCNKANPEEYYAWDKEIFTLKSDYGYRLSCELLDGRSKELRERDERKSHSRVVILCHGLGCAKYTSLKYAAMFFRLGFRVLIYDHRNHGYSGKAHTSMGFYEKYDLKKLVDWCIERFGTDCRIITHGESMGAATVLMHLGIDHRISAAIADCAYSDLTQLLCHQLKHYYHLPCFLIPVESLLTYLRAGFWYSEVSPVSTVRRTLTPILFIHGKNDHYVPAAMSKEMYACKKKNKALYLVAGARHAESYCRNKEGYEKVVERFLRNWEKGHGRWYDR